MYMIFPNNIKIGGLNIKIFEVEPYEIDGDCGESRFDVNTIKINKALDQQSKELSFIHEIFHHIDPALTESQVELYSRSIYQIIRDNKFI